MIAECCGILSPTPIIHLDQHTQYPLVLLTSGVMAQMALIAEQFEGICKYTSTH